MKDPKGLLIQQTKNTQAARQIRFTNVREIAELAPVVKAYLREAINVEESGLQVKYKKTSEFTVPKEFQVRLDQSPALKNAFKALTPGRQRAYLLFFSAPKQSKTRAARIDKCVRQILGGKELRR